MYKQFYKGHLAYLSADILLLTGATYAAFLMRLGFDTIQHYNTHFYRILPVILIIKIVSLSLFGIYRGIGHVINNLNIIMGSVMGTLIIFCLILFGVMFEGIPRSIFIIDCCFAILFVSGYRLGIRMYSENTSKDILKRKTLTFAGSILCVLWLTLNLIIEWRLCGMPGVEFFPTWTQQRLMLPVTMERLIHWMFF